MSLTWIPLLESALRDLAYKQGNFIAPQSWCMVTDGPGIARFQDGSELDTTHYLVNAILYNQFSQTCDERTFLLPSLLPEESLAKYSVNFDNDTGILHVASRFRYVTLKELFLLRKIAASAGSKPVVEFSKGKVSAIPLDDGVCTNDPENIVQASSQAQGTVHSSALQQKRSRTPSDSNTAAEHVPVSARKSFQEKGARLTIDALASLQHDMLDSAPQTRSSSSESCNEIISTPATCATSSKFPLPLDSPNITAPDRETAQTEAVRLDNGDAAHLDMIQVTWSAVQDLPSFHIHAEYSSLCCQALDLVRPNHSDILNEPLAFLDLGSAKPKDIAYAIQKKFPLVSPDSADVEIALDESSGELFLQSVPPKLPSQSSIDILDLDAMFGDDDDDLDFQSVTPKVKLPTAAPVHTCMTLQKAIALNTLSLRQGLSEDTIEVLDIVNSYYREVWMERHKKPNSPPEDQPKYHEATYNEAIKDQAVTWFESHNIAIPRQTLELVQPFILVFLQIWCAGPGGRPNKPDRRWIPGVDEPVVNAIAVKLIEWQQIVDSSKQTQSVQLRPGSVAIQEASSPSDWYLEAIGGDAQYREHRRVDVEESDDEKSEYGGDLPHHINFNNYPVDQRSYTPPEVSFWAAATTYDKILVQRPSLPPKDKNLRLKPLPAVHFARVLAAQAFKWVDPTKYTGDNIFALWEKKGCAMRDAATSDVHVVYQPVGTWTLDHFTEDDVIPTIAPNDRKYEYATNGNFHFLQLPHYVYDSSDEHRMVKLNVGKQPKHHFHSYVTQTRSPTSLLQYELGAELKKKTALLEKKLQKRSSLRKPISFLDIVEEEASDADEDVIAGDEDDTSEAATDVQDGFDPDREPLNFVESSREADGEASAGSEDRVIQDQETTSDTATDVEDATDLDREPAEFAKSSGEVEGETSTVGADPAVQDEDDLSEAVTDDQVAPDLDQGSQLSLEATGVEYAVPALEDGRYLSPSKMVPSRMDLARTPPQSPSKADDLGSWELDEAGHFVSPSKSGSSTGSLTDDDDIEENSNQIADQIDPFSWDTALSSPKLTSDIVQYPSVQLMGKPWDGDDVFKLGAVHENDVSRDLGEINVDAEIKETYASIARIRAQRLQSRTLNEDRCEGNAPRVEEGKESFDGENGITDHTSLWAERPDRVAHPRADLLSRFCEDKKSDCSEVSKANLPSRFSDGERPNPMRRSGPQNHPKAAFLARFADRDPAPKSNKRLLSIINDGETFTPSTNPGDFALGPEYPNLIVGECAPADFNDSLIQDELNIPGLDAEYPTASSDQAITIGGPQAALPPLDSHQAQPFSHYLSPMQEGGSETDGSPVRSRKLITRTAVPQSSSKISPLQDVRSCRVLNTNPNISDADFEELLLERFAQQEKKRSGMTVIYDLETAEYYVSPQGDLLIQTDCKASIAYREDDTGEDPSPTTSGHHSRDSSSGQSSAQTSPSSLDGEDIEFTKNKSASYTLPGKLNIDETSPEWLPLANCWKHIAVAVKGLPQRHRQSGTPAATTPRQAASGRVPQHAHQPRPHYGAIAIVMGHFAVELAMWVFWKCMW